MMPTTNNDCARPTVPSALRPVTFFFSAQAYRPVLEALQSISTDPTAMPFVTNLLCTSTNVPPPAYLRFGGRAPRLHLNAAFPGNDTVHAARPDGVDVLAEPWPELAHTLDQSQFAAIQLAMRHSIALIQVCI
ncbi:hypothetical protein T492DRAFT_49187 [Pavlovales sp. CCMP2436]|nr:hypothetical protein T492DRAFT_49187 [Pavlovales sp. CCMP2436]